MIKYLFTVFLVLISFIFVNPVSAHILKSDGSIGAVLHVDPDDDPIAKESTGFFFDFKDKTGKFKPENCECKVSITENGNEIFSQPLFQNNQNQDSGSTSIFFTFPEKAVYQVKVTGNPLTPDAFQSFTLNYDIRVARDSTTKSDSNNKENSSVNLVWVFGAGIILAFLLGLVISGRKKKIAVIIIAGALLLHSVPVKAIHASHDGNFSESAFACCLPAVSILTSADIPVSVPVFFENFFQLSLTPYKSPAVYTASIRSPPVI